MKQINVELLAIQLHKLRTDPFWAATIKAFPRAEEAMVFVQGRAMAVGLDAFVDEFLARECRKVGTSEMAAAGPGPWTLEQALPVWEAMRRIDLGQTSHGEDFSDWAVDKIFVKGSEDWQSGLLQFNYDYFAAVTQENARLCLAEFLKSLCEGREWLRSPPWYFAALFDALASFMDDYATTIEAKLAPTSAKEKIFRRLAFADTTGTPVIIFGDTAAGKSVGAKAFVQKHLGRWRYSSMPSGDGPRRFFEVQCEALGVPFSPTMPLPTLQTKLEFVIQNLRVGLIFDEAQFAIPANYTAKTPPHRLNWIRCEVIDRGIVAAFFCTRQDFKTKLRRYVKETQYQFQQWIRRIAEPLTIEGQPSFEDIQAVGLKLFPAIDPDIIALAAAGCEGRKTGLQELKPLLQYVVFVAKQAGRASPTLEDYDCALREYLHEADQAPAPRQTTATTSRGARGARKTEISDTHSEPARQETTRLVTA